MICIHFLVTNKQNKSRKGSLQKLTWLALLQCTFFIAILMCANSNVYIYDITEIYACVNAPNDQVWRPWNNKPSKWLVLKTKTAKRLCLIKVQQYFIAHNDRLEILEKICAINSDSVELSSILIVLNNSVRVRTTIVSRHHFKCCLHPNSTYNKVKILISTISSSFSLKINQLPGVLSLNSQILNLFN